jgi:hypothetical protein
MWVTNFHNHINIENKLYLKTQHLRGDFSGTGFVDRNLLMTKKIVARTEVFWYPTQVDTLWST